MSIVITKTYATTELVILRLSEIVPAGDEAIWKDCANYELSWKSPDETLTPINDFTDNDINYIDQIPAIIFSVKGQLGDSLVLTCSNLEETFEIPVEDMPSPIEITPAPEEEPQVSEAFQEILSKLAALEESVGKLKSEDLHAIQTSITNLQGQVTAIDDVVQPLKSINFANMVTSIGDMHGTVTAINGVVQPLTSVDFTNIQTSVGDMRGKLTTIVDAVITDLQEPLIGVIEKKLQDQQAYLRTKPAEKGKSLANQVINEWQAVLDLCDQAYGSRKLSPDAKKQVQRLQTDIRKNISFIGTQKELLLRKPTLAKDERLIKSTDADITKALDAIVDIKKLMEYGGSRL